MLTTDFFTRVLPESGPYYLVVFKKDRGPAHKAFDSLDAMAAAAARFDADPSLSVYYCCSAGQPSGSSKRCGAESPDGRAKSLWVDVDCGPDKGYADQKTATSALLETCKGLKLPIPMIVGSGSGLHCYWTFTKSIPYTKWRPLAGALKTALTNSGFQFDRGITTDFARILRPVGTKNKKSEPLREVRVIYPAQPLTPQEMLAALKDVVSSSIEDLPQVKPADDLNDDLVAHLGPTMDSSAVAVAEKCAQVAKMRDTKGDVSYEHWRGVIGIIKHCIEGIDLAHEWTSERQATGHSQVDTETRYNTWTTPPPTCEFFSQHNPSGCSGCPHKGKIKTPIVLGRVVPVQETTFVEAKVDGVQTQVQVPKLPQNYDWKDGYLVRYLQDKDGVWQPFAFCRTLFYPIYRLRKENDGFALGIRMHLPDNRAREFTINTGLLTSPSKLMEELGHAGEIVQSNIKDAGIHMAAYLRDALEKLKAEAEELNTMTAFGWKQDMQSFLIGNRLYCRDGTTKRVLVGGYAAGYLSHFPTPAGSKDGYASALNHIYNRIGMEPMQYAICSGYGSVLTPFGENLYRGLLVAITGGDTAKGKSTVCMASMYGFGDAERMTIATENGSTTNARYAQMGTYSNLPLLFDEYTNVEPKDLSDFAYRVTQGVERGRLISTAGGLKKAAQVEWAMSPFVTANKDLHAILSQHTANSQAEAVRMVQIKIDETPLPQLDPGVVDSAMTQMRLNAGCAGEAMIQRVVSDIDGTFRIFQDTMAEVSRHINDPKYRFYRNHAACTLTAAKILRELKIVEFDYDRLFDYTIALMRKLGQEVAETNTVTVEDSLNMMINELTPRILSTNEYRDGRDARGPEYGNRSPSQSLAGRYIVGTGSKDPYSGRLYLVKKDMKDWCTKHRVDFNAVLAHAKTNSFLISPSERFNLTRGTSFAAAQMVCVVLDTLAMAGQQAGTGPKLVALHANGLEQNQKQAV